MSIVDAEEFLSDDEYLRSLEGLVSNIESARAEPVSKGGSLNQLDW